jgi:hypothetical protein
MPPRYVVYHRRGSMLESLSKGMQPHAALAAGDAVILRTHDERDLSRILEPCMQAVIYEPDPLPEWFAAVATAVESGSFVVPRSVLPDVTADELAGWLAAHLPESGLQPAVRDSLFNDVVALASRLSTLSGVRRFMLRIFTEAPTTDCGFHVDTVPPDATAWGLLRVYNGEGTAFVEPDNVTSIAGFYRYLGRRERLAREKREAAAAGDSAAVESLQDELRRLDEARPFLERPDEIREAKAGSIVAFKHLDIGLHWAAHPKSKAWIHCSPMCGAPRLVVNLSSPQRAPRRPR